MPRHAGGAEAGEEEADRMCWELSLRPVPTGLSQGLHWIPGREEHMRAVLVPLGD